MTIRPDLYIMKAENGRGVYCTSDIQAGELIELCPVIILSSDDREQIHKTHLHDYYFIWDYKNKTAAIALGYGSLYNHSDTANAEFLNDYDVEMIKIQAIKDIKAHEEICIQYIPFDESQYQLWFKDKK